MSEAGWRAFLAADGIDDWVVLHGGATAAFLVSSMADATRLAQAITRRAGVADLGAVLTIAGPRLTVRLTRDMWLLEAHHAGLARAISAVARSAGATAEPRSVQEVQLAIAAKPDEVDLGFWRAVLGYAPMSPTTASTRSDIARRCGCRSSMRQSRSGTRCTWTCPSARDRARATRRRPRRRRPHRRPVPGALDAVRPGRQPRVHRRLARRRHDRSGDRGGGGDAAG